MNGLTLGNSVSVGKGLSRSSYPPILDDGNTVKWFDYEENVTVAGDYWAVSSWDNKTGITGIISGALLQANTTKQPKINANGVYLNGASQYLKTLAFTIDQPIEIYMSFKLVTWDLNSFVFDGNTSGTVALSPRGSSPDMSAYAGNLVDVGGHALDTYMTLRLSFDGVNSEAQINNETPITGDFGANDMGGFTLAAIGAGNSSYTDMEVKEIIIRKIINTTDNAAAVSAYLTNKRKITTIERLGLIGDSITTTGSWWTRNITDLYIVNNHAVSAETIMADMDDQVLEAVDDNSDIIILQLGTNDDNAGDMGALQAEVEENIIELKASNPNATIYYMNVLPRWTDTGGGTSIDKSNIRTAISAACTAQSIDCWDTSTWILSTDTTDGTHPNESGGVKIWNKIKVLI